MSNSIVLKSLFCSLKYYRSWLVIMYYFILYYYTFIMYIEVPVFYYKCFMFTLHEWRVYFAIVMFKKNPIKTIARYEKDRNKNYVRIKHTSLYLINIVRLAIIRIIIPFRPWCRWVEPFHVNAYRSFVLTVTVRNLLQLSMFIILLSLLWKW